MDNVTVWIDFDGSEQVTIAHGDNQFTSMLKSTYDAMQANSTLPSNSVGIGNAPAAPTA